LWYQLWRCENGVNTEDAMKVRAGQEYIFYPNLLDRIHKIGVHSVVPGTVVRVINLHEAPPANTMGQSYIADRISGSFIGMVSCNLLYKLSDRQIVIDAIKLDILRKSALGELNQAAR
jgi:hypothetical protein